MDRLTGSAYAIEHHQAASAVRGCVTDPARIDAMLTADAAELRSRIYVAYRRIPLEARSEALEQRSRYGWNGAVQGRALNRTVDCGSVRRPFAPWRVC